MRWRARVANSPIVFRVVSKLLSGWIRFVVATSKIDRDGWSDVEEAIRGGHAVIICCWHQRIMLSPYLMPEHEGQCNSLTSHRRPGRMVGQMLKRFGFMTTPMPPGTLGAGQMRRLLRGLNNGVSICLAPDGSSGPARVCKTTPIQWARVAQVPIFTFSFSAKKAWRLPTWDNMLLPKPFTHISMCWRRWDVDVPRDLDDPENLRQRLELFMNDVCAENDRLTGHDQPVL